MISQNAIYFARQLIKEGQGLRTNVYTDSQGYLTIGYGHKLLPPEKGTLKTVTEGQASQMLEKDIQRAVNVAKNNWGKYLNPINAERTAVILDMTYNMGSFKWPLFTKGIQNQDWKEAAKQIMNSKYATQVKDRARRNACIMRDGVMYTKSNQNWY